MLFGLAHPTTDPQRFGPAASLAALLELSLSSLACSLNASI
jgi:hypothetical protein